MRWLISFNITICQLAMHLSVKTGCDLNTLEVCFLPVDLLSIFRFCVFNALLSDVYIVNSSINLNVEM